MRLSSLLRSLSLLQLGAFTLAHGDGDEFRAPQIFAGRNVLQHAPLRRMIKQINSHQKRDWSKPSFDTGKRCGEGFGNCDPGDCCSPVGYCGRGYLYCASPNCQIAFSDGCDAFIKPLGEPTIDIPRPHIGNVTYDEKGIKTCKKPGSVALTFDDGPYNWTSHVLDVLKEYNAHATFFITGNNLGKGQIDIEDNGWPAIIRRMHAEGHQIAGHSWSHQNLSSVNETMRVDQVQWLEMAFRNILGFIPTYFRPPYVACNEACGAFLKKMGYHVVYMNVVNEDWQNDAPERIENSKILFNETMSWTDPEEVDNIYLLHDTHYQTSWNFTEYMLKYLKAFNYTNIVTVGECMGDPPENWYRPAGGAPDKALLQHKRPENRGNTLQYSALALAFAQVIAYMLL